MSETPSVTTAEENLSDDDEQQVTNPQQKKEDAKVEKELDRVTDRVDDEEIGSEQIGNVKCFLFIIDFVGFSSLGFNSD